MYEELKKYYVEKKISAMDFKCCNVKDCEGDNSPNFSSAREAYVGKEYENHTLPRVLFVSLDPGQSPVEPELKTMDAQRANEATCYPSYLKKNSHWYHTHDLAFTLLRRYKEDLELDFVCPYFAHTNSAKCSQNKDDKSQADGRFFWYCKEYLKGEIAILNPDVIVTQGNQACWSIQSEYEQSITLIEVEENPQLCNFGTIEIEGRERIWFHCYHPRYGRYWSQRMNCHEVWAVEMYHHLSKEGWG